jgi:hypothetical protein
MAILFQNEQWLVSENGMMARKPSPTYEISVSRLTECTGDMSCYDWPVHMAEKTWVQSEQFIEAYNKALELLAGKYEPAADPVKRDLTVAKAREQALKTASRLR